MTSALGALIAKAERWAAGDPDLETRALVESLIEAKDVAALEAMMGDRLSFGTAGIRGQVGPGPNRMNRANVIQATYGLAQTLISQNPNIQILAVVGYDARPTSKAFAADTAGVLAGYGIETVLFPDVAPTPIVAFTAKVLGAHGAIVVTASHNPPRDNGYKVYGANASQIISPMDTEIAKAISKAPPATEVTRVENAFDYRHPLIGQPPNDLEDRYWSEVDAVRVHHSGSHLSVVYTPLHGVGGKYLLDIFERAGHRSPTTVEAQFSPDGTFPTVDFPNPEEPGALDLALELASETRADLLIANDPDADRLAAALPTDGGWRLLSGNDLGVLLGEYIVSNWQSARPPIVANSIVSSPLLGRIVEKRGGVHTNTLTGFKWIIAAGLALQSQGRGTFAFGYEEALGYSVGPTVRDKDGLSAAVVLTDLATEEARRGRTLWDRLSDIWEVHGIWASAQTSIRRPGPDGNSAITTAVERLAAHSPAEIGGMPVTDVVDYRSGADSRPVWLGSQALIVLELGDRGRVLVRPSGTEPKLKIYADLTTAGRSLSSQEQLTNLAQETTDNLAADLRL